MFENIYNLAKSAQGAEKLRQGVGLDIDVIKMAGVCFHTPASKLAFEGNHDAVERLRQSGASTDHIAHGYAMAGYYNKVEEYRTSHAANVNAIAEGYAIAGHYKKVEEYRTFHNVDVNSIARGYAMAGYHKKVEEYRISHGADVNAIAEGYAMAGYHKKVEEYRTSHGADVDLIAYGYAKAGHHEKVEEYRTSQGADVDLIAYGYAKVGLHDKVEEYRTSHGADVNAIAETYPQASNPSVFNQAINKLNKFSRGNDLISVMTRLKEGQSSWNPYWIGSGRKLECIIAAVLDLSSTDNLADSMTNKESALYQAINMQRLLPITFFGGFGINKATSVMMMESGRNNPSLK